MAITLNELKAENAAKEALADSALVEDKKEPIQDEYAEVNSELSAGEDDTSTEDGEENSELESWQLTEESETSGDDKGGFVPNHEAAKRRKQAKALKGELKEKDDELTDLRKQVEALQAGTAPQAQAPQQAALVKPTREQFDYDDDAYDAAVDKYYDAKFDNKLSSHQTNTYEKQQAAQQQQAADELKQSALDNHYDNAAKLVASGKVTNDSYRNADAMVRKSIEAIMPDRGNAITDQFISTLNNLGDGSEKVMYQLGVNPAKMQELQNKLATDPSGNSAFVFLGQLQAQIQTPNKRRSQAPAPGSKVDGEGGSNGQEGALLKKFNKLDPSNVQARIEMKRKARSQGVDVKSW